LLDHWKECIIVPIYNTGDKIDCNNYHEISSLSNSCKMLSSDFLSTFSPYTDEKNGSMMRQCVCYLWTSRQPVIRLGGKYYTVFPGFGYP
jgi:hypothetical protein